MPIETRCDGCSQQLRVGEQHAGKLARCPSCNAIYRVPVPDGLEAPISQSTTSTTSTHASSTAVSDGVSDGVSDSTVADGDIAERPTEYPGSGPASHPANAVDDHDLVETTYPGASTARVESHGASPSSSIMTPFASMPDGESSGMAMPSQWRMRTPEGNVYGPVPRRELDVWVREGRVSADCELCEDGGRWFWADAMFPQLRPEPQSYRISPAAAPSYVPPQNQRRRRLASDRGAVILTLGIMAWVIVCPFISLIAWVMGTKDLGRMDRGEMVQTNRGMTQVGRVLGAVHVILALCLLGAAILFAM